MSKHDPEYYQQLEAALSELADTLVPYLTTSQLTFLREEIAAGEYELALESMVDFIWDEGKEGEVGLEINGRIHALAVKMGLQGENRFKNLHDKGD